MLETITLDSRTLIIKADNEVDLPDILDTINKKYKVDNVNSFLKFASTNRVIKEMYKFTREDCYGR